MAFDLNAILQDPQFQTGLGLLGASSPKNRPLLDAYNMMQQMQQRKQEQEKVKQYLELQKAQEARLETQNRLYEEQLRLQKEAALRKQKIGEAFGQMLPGLLGDQAPAQMPQTQQPPSISPQPPVGGTFNLADQFVAKIEGGFVPNDAGKGPTNQGVNQRANPDINVRNAPPEILQQRRRQYWDNIQGDQIEQVYGPQAAIIAYDSAINQGQDYAKRLIEKTGGDPTLMLYQRRQDYRELAKNPLYKPHLKGWEARLDQLTQQIKAPTAQPTQSQQPATTGGGLDQYRRLQQLSGVFKGMNEDYAGAVEAFAGAVKPEVRKPGDIIIGPGGQQIQIPDPLGQRRVAAEEAGVGIRQRAEERAAIKAQQELRESKTQDWKSYRTADTNLSMLDSKINELLASPGAPRIFGLVGAFPTAPGTPAADAQAKLTSITKQLAKESLQAIRDASKTGGALGNVSNQDIQLLETAIQNLENSQSWPAAQKAMTEIKQYTQRIRGIALEGFEKIHGETPEGLPPGYRKIGTQKGKAVYQRGDDPRTRVMEK